nr:hypothetical protein [Pandoravirus massiliensis]
MSDPRLGYAYSYGAEPSGFVGAPRSAAGAVWRGAGTARTRELGRSGAVAPLAWNNQPAFGAGLGQTPAYDRSYGGAGATPYASSGYSDDEGSAGSEAEEAFSDVDDAGSDDEGVVYSDDENGDVGDSGAGASWGGGIYGPPQPPQSSWW